MRPTRQGGYIAKDVSEIVSQEWQMQPEVPNANMLASRLRVLTIAMVRVTMLGVTLHANEVSYSCDVRSVMTM